MPVNWTEVNERRIGEKMQEILLYCAQTKAEMTPRAFDLARLSFERLLDNIVDRNPRSLAIVLPIRQSLNSDNDCVAVCSKKRAENLARTIVYKYISDDLDLYPVTAEKKLTRSKVRGLKECDIPKDELTEKDMIYVVAAIVEGENFSKSTMRTVFEWFQQIGLDPFQARIFAYLFLKQEPARIKSIPQYNLFSAEYRKAAKSLLDRGYLYEFPGELLGVTETTIE